MTTRRQFITALAAAPLAAAAPKAPAEPARPRKGTRLGGHDPALGEECDCLGCRQRRRQEGSHPLHAAALIASLRANDALLVLRATHDCEDEDGCEVCTDARHMYTTLLWTEGLLEGDWVGEEGDEADRAQAESRRLREALDKGKLPPLPPRRGPNHPAHEPAVMALLDMADACAALAEGHPDPRQVADGETGAYLAKLFADLLSGPLISSAALIRRRYFAPGERLSPEWERALAVLERREAVRRK